MKKILTIALIVLFSANAQAGYWNNLKNNVKDTWNCGDYELYVPVNVWHNRLFYDQEHLDKYNEEPWGFGFGKGLWKGNEWHGLYLMGFKDSNFYLQTIGGYAYTYNWNLDEANDWRVGVGYTLSLTQREDYSYIPVPLPLPVASVNYKKFSVQAAYVPGVKNDGNVLFTWLKWTF